MKIKYNTLFFITLLFILFVGLAAVSAADNITDDSDYTEISADDSETIYNDEKVNDDIIKEDNNDKTEIIENNTQIKKETIIRVTPIKDNSKYITVKGIMNNIEGKRFSNTNLTITLNDNYTTEIKTDKNGIFSYVYSVDELKYGLNNITLKYYGNNNYSSKIVTTTINHIMKESVINVSPIKNSTPASDTITIKGIVSNIEGKRLSNVNVMINLNNVWIPAKADKNGIYKYDIPTGEFYKEGYMKSGLNNVSITYYGNKRYSYSRVNTTFNYLVGTKETIIIITPIKDNANQITIKGIVSNTEGKRFSNADLRIKLNNHTLYARTNQNGIFNVDLLKYNMSSQVISGINNISVTYIGNSKYASKTVTTTFNHVIATKETIIRITPIKDKSLYDNLTIKGIVSNAEGKRFSNANLSVFINNKVEYRIKTGKNGIFELTMLNMIEYEREYIKKGINNVTIEYKGYGKYAPATTTTTFNLNTDLKETIIELSPIKDNANQITIKGIVSNTEGKTFSNAKLIIQINNEKYLIKTDKNGSFSLEFSSNELKDGKNNVSITYQGNSRYAAKTLTTTFNNKIRNETIINILPITYRYSEDWSMNTMIINGYLTDTAGKGLSHEEITLVYDDYPTTMITNNLGEFIEECPMGWKEYTINLTLIYEGNSIYASQKHSIIFDVDPDYVN